VKEVPLVGNQHVALVDDDDYERVAAHRWHYTDGYATNSKVGYMHCLIMRPPEGYIVHHKNRNRLDNRKSELEVLTHKEHGQRHARDPKNRRPRKPKPKREALSVRLYPEHWEQLRELADRNFRPLNSEIQIAIEEYLTANGITQK
jgi:hypothetical protein